MIAGLSAVGARGADAGRRRAAGAVSPGGAQRVSRRRSARRSARRSERCKRAKPRRSRASQGAAAPMKVVESVMEAQRSLQSVLAIRDKVVSAYQEIARMAI